MHQAAEKFIRKQWRAKQEGLNIFAGMECWNDKSSKYSCLHILPPRGKTHSAPFETLLYNFIKKAK